MESSSGTYLKIVNQPASTENKQERMESSPVMMVNSTEPPYAAVSESSFIPAENFIYEKKLKL